MPDLPWWATALTIWTAASLPDGIAVGAALRALNQWEDQP